VERRLRDLLRKHVRLRCSSPSHDSRSASAASIGAMVVVVLRVEVWEGCDGVSEFARARAQSVQVGSIAQFTGIVSPFSRLYILPAHFAAVMLLKISPLSLQDDPTQ
jgi:hypothetical protein